MTIEPQDFLTRLDHHDATLWPAGNVSANRLGWLSVPFAMERAAKDLTRWAESIDEETVVILGMGGSSLGPLVLASFAETLGSPSGRRVVVCDTTDPTTVGDAPIEGSFIIVSSKSGTTLEPNVLFAHARTRQPDLRRYAVITDPDTPLAAEARNLGVNRLFENQPDIGGRYSVLSHFGLVPAALAGYDVAELCGRALDVDRAEAVGFGLEMGEAADTGQDKATFRVERRLRPFGLWLEQLIAESTGKLGRGVVPVPTSDEEHGEDRFGFDIAFSSAAELGGAFFRFELAVAAASHVLAIDPFDEPNVAESKANTNAVLEKLPLEPLAASDPSALDEFLGENVKPGDYVSLQAYLPYGNDDALETLRCRIRDEFSVPVTAGYGPRFLHSTGQLHKGGPNSVVAVQLVRRSPQPAVPIPQKPYDFGTLITAQAIGDHQSLVSHGRRVIRIAIDDLSELT